MQDISAHGEIDAGSGFGTGHSNTTVFNFWARLTNGMARGQLESQAGFFSYEMRDIINSLEVVQLRPDPDGLAYEWGDNTMRWLVRAFDPANNARIYGYGGARHVTSNLLFEFAERAGIDGITELTPPCRSFPAVPVCLD